MKTPEYLREDLLQLLPAEPALLALDFDGVMTDDRVFVREDGREMVVCTRGDGLGVTMLRRAGFPVLVLSTETNPVVAARSSKLKVECIQGIRDKTREFTRILEDRKIPPAAVVFVGNDVNDLGCIELSGCGLVVADAHPLVRAAAKGVLTHRGGQGAVREVAELLLLRLGKDLIFNESDRR
jgi:N-acylneuraminate cytidylyltransferase